MGDVVKFDKDPLGCARAVLANPARYEQPERFEACRLLISHGTTQDRTRVTEQLRVELAQVEKDFDAAMDRARKAERKSTNAHATIGWSALLFMTIGVMVAGFWMFDLLRAVLS